MRDPWLSFLIFTILSVLVQGFFALFEMACVSFNKIRLHYFASLGQKRALWLSELIDHPLRLFGTTLIGVTTSLQIGSECARRFYEALGLNPDLAPLTQVFVVVIFGELVPMFTARRHPEQLAMAFAPVMFLVSKILSPIIWAFDMIAKGIQGLIGKSQKGPSFLSREEVQKAFEEGEEVREEFNILLAKVFRMKALLARQLMMPIDSMQMIASTAFVSQVRYQLKVRPASFLPVYHNTPQNIVAIVYLRDLLFANPKKKAIDIAKPPWFVTQDASVLQIMDQFRRNNQTIAIILDKQGQACGILSLDQMIDALFGPEQYSPLEIEKGGLYVERTLSGSLTVEQFNQDFQANLPFEKGDTLSDLIVAQLSHAPVRGESVEIGSYEFTVIDPTIRGAKTLSVKTVE